MSWQSFKQKVSESAIDFALDAFWVGVWGIVATGVAAGILFVRGASAYVLVALASVGATLLGVLAVTSVVVLLQRRARLASIPPRVGRKGFLDYKIQGIRALSRVTGSLEAMTYQISRVGRELTTDAIRMQRAQRRHRNTDERGYRAMKKAASHLEKRAVAMKLHATNYASDVHLFIEGTGKWIDWVLAKGAADRNQLVDFARTLQVFREAMDSSIPKIEAFRAAVEEGREASEQMDLAGGSLSEAVTIAINATVDASKFCAVQIPRLSG